MATKDDAKELKSIVEQWKDVTRQLNNELKTTKALAAESLSPFENLVDIFDKLEQHKTRENQLSSDELKKLSKKLQLEKENQLNSQKALDSRLGALIKEEEKLKNNLIGVGKTTKAYKETVKALQDVQKEMNENANTSHLLQQRIDDTTGEVENLEKALAKAANQAKKLESLKKVGGALDKISTPLDGMLNPMNLINKAIGFAVNTALEFDKRLGDTAKSMNLTYKEAEDSNRAMIKFAQSTGDAFLNSQNLNKTVVDLNKNLGTSIKFEQLTGALKEDVALMSKLENMAGLTAEESQEILKYTLATGQSAKNAVPALMANYKVAGLKRGVVLNEKDALKEISKLSNSIKLSTAGGAAGLAKSVAAAKALGTDLNKVNDIAGSLLNFEESIEAELSAELLTGKNLNLEKAREAALNNDLATVSDEIAKNVGSAADFANMNRISQESIAKAVGMTRDELATTLTNQESLKNIGASSVEQAREQYDLAVAQGREKEFLNELGNEELEKQFKQQSSQEMLVELQKQSADKIIDTIAGFDEWKKRIKDIYDAFMKVFEKFGGFKTLLIGIGAIIALKMVKGMFDFISSASTAMKVLKEIKVAEKINAGIAIVKGAWSSEGSTPGVGPILAAAAIGAGMATLAAVAMDDGVIGPSGGGGYGSRVLYGPEGAISFNNKDTIVAGTDLFKANDMVSSPKGTVQVASNNNSSKEIAELRSAIMALATRPVDVAIDGTKVIEATTGRNPNTQGLESAKNSFKMQ